MEDTNRVFGTYTSFAGTRLIASADLRSMLEQTKEYLDRESNEPVLIFDDQTGQQVDFDFRGAMADVLRRAEAMRSRTGPGRPKLGVVAREVTLLPRHWGWLEQQANGASAALRRLVEAATRQDPDAEQARRARDAASRFLWCMAGNLPLFEEASRALFAGDHERFQVLIADWPDDVRTHVLRLLGKSPPGHQDTSKRRPAPES